MFQYRLQRDGTDRFSFENTRRRDPGSHHFRYRKAEAFPSLFQPDLLGHPVEEGGV